MKKDSDFRVEIPEELNVHLKEIELTEEILNKGNTLQEMTLPERTLVMMIKRDIEFLVPNGQMELKEGDILLIISQDEQERLTDYYNHTIE